MDSERALNLETSSFLILSKLLKIPESQFSSSVKRDGNFDGTDKLNLPTHFFLSGVLKSLPPGYSSGLTHFVKVFELFSSSKRFKFEKGYQFHLNSVLPGFSIQVNQKICQHLFKGRPRS